MVLVLTTLLASAVPVSTSAEVFRYLPDAEEHRGRSNLLVVLATNRNDDRVFDLHLDLSIRWDAVLRREIHPIDVLPPRGNVQAAAQALGVSGESFALVLISKEGEILYRGTDPRAITEIFVLLDLAEQE